MGSFRTVIGCNFDQYETGSFEPNRYLVLDTQEEKTVKASAVLAKQPLQSGDTMADHMYREPTTFSISGQFSLNGKNWDDDSYDFMQKGDRLTNIQEVFEKIKDEGILCRLTTIDEDDFAASAKQSGGVSTLKANARSRFKTRDHMALRSISWTERQNSVKFSFDFEEVIMVEKQEYEELSEEEKDAKGFPHVVYPVGSSLGSVLADTDALGELVVKALYDAGYMEDDWIRATAEQLGKSVGIATAVAMLGWSLGILTTIGASAVMSSGLAVSGSFLLVFPVGTVIAVVAAAIAAIGIGIWSFLNWKAKREKQEKAFKLVNGDPEPDLQRLQNLIDDITIRVNKVRSSLTIYAIQENVEQTVTINIGGQYYLIEFSKNNAEEGQSWGAKVTDMEGNPLSTVRHTWCPVASYFDLNRSQNLWFKDKSLQYEVYLVNPSLSQQVNDTEEKLENAKARLDGYSIWVSGGDIQTQIKKTEDAINAAIEAEGFI